MDWRQARVRLTLADGAVVFMAFATVDQAREFVELLPMAQVYERLFLDVWRAAVVPLEAGCN